MQKSRVSDRNAIAISPIPTTMPCKLVPIPARAPPGRSKKFVREPLIKPNNDITADTGSKVDLCFLKVSSASRVNLLLGRPTYQIQFDSNLEGGIFQITLRIHGSAK